MNQSKVKTGRGVAWTMALALVALLEGCNGLPGGYGQREYDSLFLGISLGMEKQGFYDYCWEMNRQGKFIHGPANMEVEYKLHDLEHTVLMRFYPNFYKDRIYEMPVTFTYESWAPWNRSLQSDSLLVRMVPIFEKWYGQGFKVVQHPSQGKVYVKRDGYRRINLFVRDDQFVQAVITDMDSEIAKNKEEHQK